jgi:CheY-like chemotaxis protein
MASSSPAEVHVLLVDDDRVTRMVVASLLRKCNYQGTHPHYGTRENKISPIFWTDVIRSRKKMPTSFILPCVLRRARPELALTPTPFPLPSRQPTTPNANSHDGVQRARGDVAAGAQHHFQPATDGCDDA